jgi:beta-lactamase regulating signal transducer with metallopeptidase domain
MIETERLLTSVVLGAAWQIPVIVGAALLGDLLLRRSTAAARHRLWRAALVLALIVPGVTVLPRGSAAVRPGRTLPSAPAVALNPVPTETIPAAARLAFSVPATVGGVALVVALLSAAFRGGRLLLALRRASRWRRFAVEESSPRLRTLLRECEEAIGVRAVTLLRAEGLEGPITLGVLHPLVVLPASFPDLHDDDALRAALGHELAHVRRRDFLANLAHELALAPFAWHPAAGVLRRRLDRTREMACDELASERLLGPRRYARSLVAVAAGISTFAPAPTLGINDAGTLEERVRHLLVRRATPDGRRPLRALLAVGLLLFTAISASRAIVEAEPVPTGSSAKGRSSMNHVLNALILALAMPAGGNELEKGLAAFEKGDLVTASASVERAIAANPKDRDALYTLGVIRWKESYEAIGKFPKGGQLDQVAQKRLQKSLTSGHDALAKALAIDPNFVDAILYDSLLFRLDAQLAPDPTRSESFLAKAKERLARAKEIQAAGGSSSAPAPRQAAAPPPPPPPPAAKKAGSSTSPAPVK